MRNERSCPDSAAGRPSAAQQDARAERGVLTCLLGDHPDPYTAEELVREVAEDPEDFGQRDAVKRAIRSLAAVGLMHRSESLVAPSRAALRFERLEEGGER
jgi:Fe2+ or Zn2+ uptake regulation protein